MERLGHLDDPVYLAGLDPGHLLRPGQNVSAFSMACASLQLLQMLALVLAPLGQSNPGAQVYHFVGHKLEWTRRRGAVPSSQRLRLMAIAAAPSSLASAVEEADPT